MIVQFDYSACVITEFRTTGCAGRPKTEAYVIVLSKERLLAQAGPGQILKYGTAAMISAGDWDSNLLCTARLWAGIFVIEQATGVTGGRRPYLLQLHADKRHVKAVANT